MSLTFDNNHHTMLNSAFGGPDSKSRGHEPILVRDYGTAKGYLPVFLV